MCAIMLMTKATRFCKAKPMPALWQHESDDNVLMVNIMVVVLMKRDFQSVNLTLTGHTLS